MPSETPLSKALSSQPVPAIPCRRTEPVDSQANISPVMKLRKLTTSPAETSAHLLCVPGRQTTPSQSGAAASTPATCVSSPRITSAEGRACDSPGTMDTAMRGSRAGARVRGGPSGGQGTAR